MGACLIVYHKNAQSIYPQQWTDQFVKSIEDQTHKDFDILEMNYGNTPFRLFSSSDFYQADLPNFVEAMKFLITTARTKKYDYIFNSNCDDWDAPNRIELQLQAFSWGYDIIGTEFCLIDHPGRVTHTMNFAKLNIQQELSKDHNIICHPSVAYRSDFFNHFSYESSEIPREDLLLWKRAMYTKKFYIVPQICNYHRIHQNAVCNSNNR